ncbi:hypothetical protein AB0F81_16410 [Actinoplanes sp. NPDC024001]|uniref:hypothetical protein n=1 Tax=Actinoplanes sp. NPDC024001 TaxID=3154598 RepID=UPI0033C9D114
MRCVRARTPLLICAVVFAAAPAAGILLADPVWRYAEVLFYGLLLASTVVSGLSAPRWALPAAVGLLLVDAVRTLPAEPGAGGQAWLMVAPADSVDTPSEFESALALCWAPLAAVILLLAVIWRRDGGPRRRGVLAAGSAVMVIGAFAIMRIAQVALAVRSGQLDAVIAVVLAVLPGLALALTALALAAVLARHGRWLAAAGAALLAIAAVAHLDASIGAVPLPLDTHRVALSSWSAFEPTLTMPQPFPALTSLVELAAFALLVVGLTRARP